MDITPKAFDAISKLDISKIENLTNDEIRPFLPCLARIALRPAIEFCQQSVEFSQQPINFNQPPIDFCQPSVDFYEQSVEFCQISEIQRKKILEIISKNEDFNSIISLLTFDFHGMEIDVRKELEQRSNLRDFTKTSINDNVIISSIVNNLSLDDGFCRHRLIVSELLAVQTFTNLINTNHKVKDCFYKSELFDHEIYINELSDVICIALTELPNTLRLLDVVEALLYVKTGPRLISRIAANFSYHFNHICLSLLKNSNNEESSIGNVRTNVLRILCKISPLCAPVVRSAAIEMCKMPELCLHLSLDHLEFFHNHTNSNGHLKNSLNNHINNHLNNQLINDNDEQNKSARYINDLVQFVRNILISNENKAKSWLKDGQKLEEKLSIYDYLNKNDLNKNEVLHEPVYTLVYQVYNKLDELLVLNEDHFDDNKELVFMFANVFTLFNATISEKLKLQHEMEDYKDRNHQLTFLNTKEKENVHRLKEKLEEYEAQIHEDLQKYEFEMNLLESKIKNLEKDKRKLQFENEDNLKELKHVFDSISTFINLITEYSLSDYGIAQFFQVFHTFMEELDSQNNDKTKLLTQLNNVLVKKLVDVKNEFFRYQAKKILTQIKCNEERINKIFENGSTSFIRSETNSFSKSDFSSFKNEEIIDSNFYNEKSSALTYQFEDDLTERINQLKIKKLKINQANSNSSMKNDSVDDFKNNFISKENENFVEDLNIEEENYKKQDEKNLDLNDLSIKTDSEKDEISFNQTSSNNSNLSKKNDENFLNDSLIELANLIFYEWLDKFVHNNVTSIYDESLKENLTEKNNCNLTDILNTGLVKVNSNNEIVPNVPNELSCELSQAKLMLINENSPTNEEDIYHRFEPSLTEIITNSVSDISSSNNGETLKSILDSKSDYDTENSKMIDEKVLIIEKSYNFDLFLQKVLEQKKVVDVLLELSKIEEYSEFINQKKLLKNDFCNNNNISQKKIKKLNQLTSKKNVSTETKPISLSSKFTNTFVSTKDCCVNTEKIKLKSIYTSTDKIKNKSVSCSVEPSVKDVEINCCLMNSNSKKKKYFKRYLIKHFILRNENPNQFKKEKLFIKLKTANKSLKYKSYYLKKINEIQRNQKIINKINSISNNQVTDTKLKQNGHHENGSISKKETLNKKEIIKTYDVKLYVPPLPQFFIIIFFFIFKHSKTILTNLIIFLFFFILILQLISTKIPPFYSWEEIILQSLSPYLKVYHSKNPIY